MLDMKRAERAFCHTALSLGSAWWQEALSFCPKAGAVVILYAHGVNFEKDLRAKAARKTAAE